MICGAGIRGPLLTLDIILIEVVLYSLKAKLSIPIPFLKVDINGRQRIADIVILTKKGRIVYDSAFFILT